MENPIWMSDLANYVGFINSTIFCNFTSLIIKISYLYYECVICCYIATDFLLKILLFKILIFNINH